MSGTAVDLRIHHWLHGVAVKAGYTGEDAERFRAAVARRLHKGGQEYGDEAFLERPFAELLAEAEEETADCPGWLSIAVEGLQADSEGRPEEIVAHVDRILVEAAAKAVEARHLVLLAGQLWEEYAPDG